MSKCREGKSEVSFDKATHKCGKCGARTANRSHICQPQLIVPPPPNTQEECTS